MVNYKVQSGGPMYIGNFEHFSFELGGHKKYAAF